MQHQPPARAAGPMDKVGQTPRIINVPPEKRPNIQHRDVERLCSFWKKETGCDVEQIREGGKFGKLIRFDLRGSSTQQDAAVRIVNRWIDKAKDKGLGTSTFAKLSAFDPNKWYYDEINALEVERKLKFKNPPPEGQELPVKIIVPWPTELLATGSPVTPRDAFGNKLEALDGIRIDDEVFIQLIPYANPLWQVEIQGYEDAHVQAAEEHYYNMIQKVKNKQRGGSPAVNIILDEREGTKVFLDAAELWWPNKEPKWVPRLDADLMDTPGHFRDEPLDPERFSILEREIRRSLEAIRFEKGSYDFAIRLCCFALSGLDENKIKEDLKHGLTLSKFRKSIDMGVSCVTKKWLAQHEHGKKLLVRLMEAKHLLEPIKASSGYFGFTSPVLRETRPIFRGIWVMRDPNQPASEYTATTTRSPGRSSVPKANSTGVNATKPTSPSPIVIQIDWTEDEFDTYEKGTPRFYRLKRGSSSPKENMDINLLELGESKTWHFGLESLNLMSRGTVPPSLLNFAERAIQMDSANSKHSSSTAPFAQWRTGPSDHVIFHRLEKVYAFGIKKTNYRVEVAAMWYPNQTKPCWGLAVRHREWETDLSELERLLQGRGAEWTDPVEWFFPANGLTSKAINEKKMDHNSSLEHGKGAGVKLLVRKLMQLSKIVKGGDLSQPLGFRPFSQELVQHAAGNLVDV